MPDEMKDAFDGIAQQSDGVTVSPTQASLSGTFAQPIPENAMPDSNAALALQEFGHKIGLPQIAFNDDRLCSLSFDDIIVNFELSADTRTLTVYLWIAEIALERRTEVALAIADANFLFAGTRGATLGMNRTTGDLALVAQLPDATLTLAALEQSLENFVNLTEAWQQRLANGKPFTDEARPSVQPADFDLSLRA